MKSFDVIVEQQNGHYQVSVPAFPHIAEGGDTLNEAVDKVKRALENYLAKVRMVTVTVDVPAIEVGNYSTARDWIRAATLYQQEDDDLYQQYQAALAAEKQRQREEAEREADLSDDAR